MIATCPAYSREQFDAVYEEGLPLLEAHYREISQYLDIPLTPDVERYRQLEANGVLRIYTVRADGRLVGYAVFAVSRNPHYTTCLQAAQDILFVDQTFRKGRLGIKLIQFSEEQLRSEGVQVVYHHVKVLHPALGSLLQHMGYEHVEQIYAKRLD